MKNVLLSVLFFVGLFLVYPNDKKPVNDLNDELFSFEIKPSVTSHFISIETNVPNQLIEIKIVDQAGHIRVRQKLHLDREIDVSGLREGFYIVKVYAGNNTAIKRFYKGQDRVNTK
ncbi:T9SS type A sorting domain-containing protein [Aquimarina mytili]|uniref:T9SS type A sorting domain-containing protein n=1 Tax=Aquimarina mytili TaxID=874423 RepID=A0A937DCK4_9FLAO|nr:T9SS type A sorting domain-containing protein [Aquimarina mytili]MBL0685723.1 T9SS type A sorting domain-containing protein [Aquimarina mytili]